MENSNCETNLGRDNQNSIHSISSTSSTSIEASLNMPSSKDTNVQGLPPKHLSTAPKPVEKTPTQSNKSQKESMTGMDLIPNEIIWSHDKY